MLLLLKGIEDRSEYVLGEEGVLVKDTRIEFKRDLLIIYSFLLIVEESEDSDGGGEAVGGAGRRAQQGRDSDGSDRELDIDERLNDPKLGAKKRAKLEAKIEKRAQREVCYNQ
jgi:hypothetical protein